MTPAVELPAWVVSFVAADWPEGFVVEEGRAPHRVGGRQRWAGERSRWCREHGVGLLGLIRARRVEGIYDHLRGPAAP